MKRFHWLALLATLTTGVWVGSAAAAPILDTGAGPGFTNRSSDHGPGQGVHVSTATELTRIGFYLGTTAGTNVKFLIFDETNTNLLYSQVQYLAPTGNGTLFLSDPFSFSMTAGSTYYFGIISDANFTVSYFFSPGIELSQNGLTLLYPNTNYRDFSNPTYSSSAAATIALQLHGNTARPVPEPVGAALLSAAIGGIVIIRRRAGTRTKRQA